MMARAVLFAVAATLVIAAVPDASAGPKRGSETGPLIVSGTMVPPTQARRARAQSNKQANKCVPVTLKRRPLVSLLSLR
jgi:hypothetical protein